MDKKDICVSIAYTNLFILSKNDKLIYLKNFNINNLSHRALYSIAQMVQGTQNYKLVVECSIWDWFKFRKLYKKSKKTVKRACREMRKSHDFTKTCNEIISYIEQNQHTPGIFAEIYNEYYKVGK